MRPWGKDREVRTGWALRVEAAVLLVVWVAGFASMMAWALG